MKGNHIQTASDIFERGFNCAQAVCAAFAPELGLERTQALRVAQAFGGGIARRGEICGALSGALIVLGLKYGMVEVGDEESRNRTYQKSAELCLRFQTKNGSCKCRELIGYDLADPARYAAAKQSGVFRTTCPQLVRDAAEILEELLGIAERNP